MALKKLSPPGRRAMLSFVGLAALALLVAGRLFYLQVFDRQSLAAAALAERTRLVTLSAPRGEILDRNGTPLTLNLPVWTLWADPTQIKKPSAVAQRLAPILDQSTAALLGPLSQTGHYAVLARNLTATQKEAVTGMNINGLYCDSASRRDYPSGSLAFQVLGFTGAAGQGLAGLEQYYQSSLGGTPGQERLLVDAAGNPLPELSTVLKPARPGNNLVLTLDANIQALAEEALRGAMTTTKARQGRVIVVDPRNGDVLAMAQWPEANPNQLTSESLPRFNNTAIQDVFPPGSTFKPITATAALADGVATVKSRFFDPGYKIVTGHLIRGWEYPQSFGWLDWNGIMANSSDVAFMDLGLALGAQRFLANAGLFNLTRPLGIDLPGESGGVWLPPHRIEPMDLATMAFGQTESITPLQLLMAVSALANGGELMRPHVVDRIVAPDGHVVRRVGHHVIRRVASPAVTDAVVGAMKEVISHGTGTLAAVPGYTLAGKTGTAQLVIQGKFRARQYLASFIGFGPLPHPRLAILVQIYRPVGTYYGGDIAAPVFAQVMRESLAYLGIPPAGAQTLHPGRTTVPTVMGLSPGAAEAALGQVGLHLELVGGSGPIRDQFPIPGTRVSYGSLITASSLGPLGGRRTVPNLAGLSLRQAQRVVLSQGLTLWPSGSGLDVTQNPSPGTKVLPGTAVRGGFSPPGTPAKGGRP